MILARLMLASSTLSVSDARLVEFLTVTSRTTFITTLTRNQAGCNVNPFRSNYAFPNVFPFNAIRLSLMICSLDDKPPFESSLMFRETQDSANTEAEFNFVEVSGHNL
jgi:hypothetical protein